MLIYVYFLFNNLQNTNVILGCNDDSELGIYHEFSNFVH